MHDTLFLDPERERTLLWQDSLRRLCAASAARSEEAVQAREDSWRLWANEIRLWGGRTES